MAPPQRTINLEKLVPFSAPGVFMKISPELEDRIASFPQVAERVSSCVCFCYQLSHGDFEGADESRRKKHLRAALAEFVSIEEVAESDFGRKMPKILELNDGRLHVLRLLRHANTHGTATAIETFSRSAVWPRPDGEVDFDYIGYRIPNLMEEVRKSSQWCRYSQLDLASMVSWLEQDQSSWGIQNSIVKAAEEYVRVLLHQ